MTEEVSNIKTESVNTEAVKTTKTKAKKALLMLHKLLRKKLPKLLSVTTAYTA